MIFESIKESELDNEDLESDDNDLSDHSSDKSDMYLQYIYKKYTIIGTCFEEIDAYAVIKK